MQYGRIESNTTPRSPFFPHTGDPLLTQLSRDSSLHPFQKHLAVERSDGEVAYVVYESWAVGNKAAASGVDLRYFFRHGSPHGELVGCVRFDSRAGIGVGAEFTAHGGAVRERRGKGVWIWRSNRALVDDDYEPYCAGGNRPGRVDRRARQDGCLPSSRHSVCQLFYPKGRSTVQVAPRLLPSAWV